MSTPNFNLNRNASCIFAEMENENIEYTISNIQGAMERTDGSEEMFGNTIASKTKYISFAGIEIPVAIYCTYNYGYYNGASFDWELTLDDEDLNFYPVTSDEASELLESYIHDKPGFCVMQGRNLAKRINGALSDLIKEVEGIYKEYTSPLRCVGVFSNGEALYTPAGAL